jgi:hypothetical protein
MPNPLILTKAELAALSKPRRKLSETEVSHHWRVIREPRTPLEIRNQQIEEFARRFCSSIDRQARRNSGRITLADRNHMTNLITLLQDTAASYGYDL